MSSMSFSSAFLSTSDAAMPRLLGRASSSLLTQISVVLGGVIAMAALAHVSFFLPWTPVPITGQTFGITLMALLYGRRLGIATVIGYLVAGTLGLPVFAAGQALILAPTIGYLAGMVLSAGVIGSLADMGYTKTFKGSLTASLLGSVCVFALGLVVLRAFVPTGELLMAGLLPFIPGELIKSVAASAISTGARQRTN